MNRKWTKKEVATLTAMVAKHGSDWAAMRVEMATLGFDRTPDALRRKWDKVAKPGKVAKDLDVQRRHMWNAAADAVLLKHASSDMLKRPFAESDEAARCLDAIVAGLKASGLPPRTLGAIRGRLGILSDKMQFNAPTPACAPEQLALVTAPQPSAHSYIGTGVRDMLVILFATIRAARLARVAVMQRAVTWAREYDSLDEAA